MAIDTCPKRNEIAAVHNDGDGSLRLAILPVEGFQETDHQDIRIDAGQIQFPLPVRLLDEVRNPRYSPDCSKLYFSRRVGDDHDIHYWDFETKQEVVLSAEESFELYPEPTNEGVYYVSARDGSMNIYFQGFEQAPVNITQAITAHHHIVHMPEGILYGRFYSTGLQTHFLGHQEAAHEIFSSTNPKENVAPLTITASPERVESYNGLLEWVPPTFVPIVSWEFDTARTGAQALRLQGGLEFSVEDQLKNHWLLFRAFAGNRSNLYVSYWNRTLPVNLAIWGGISKIKSSYLDQQRLRLRLDEHLSLGLSRNGGRATAEPLRSKFSASTIRDTGTVYGANEIPVTGSNLASGEI